MTGLKAHGSKNGLKPLRMTKNFLETPAKMMNDQVITMLIWTVPEPLLNAIDFLSSLAERIIFLYNLRYFLTMLF